MKTVLKSLITSRRALIVLVVSFLFPLFTLAFASPVHAQAVPCPKTTGAQTTGAQMINDANQAAIKNNEFDDKVFNFNQISGTTDSLLVLLTGCSQLHPSTNQATAPNSALAAAGKAIVALYSAPPASGVQYFAGEMQKFNPIQPAYAQTGKGFDSLKPVQAIWAAFRNMSYIGFVLVFIIIGFMVMFRSKISPQAVATIQDSLPRIVVALILVTFSYAIVGLMIDTMFVFLNLAINALEINGLLPQGGQFVFQKTIFSLGVSIFGDVVGHVAKTIAGMISGIINDGAILKVVGWFVGGIAGVIAGVAVLLMIFRIFVMLLMAYISIIILTIFAPFILLLQALPGNTGAKEWFKQIAANLSVFVTVAIMLILAGIITGIKDLGGSGSTAITPGNIGQFPLLSGGLNQADIGSLIGLGFLFMTPAATKLVKDKFGIKEGGALAAGGAMAAASLGAGGTALGKPIGSATAQYRHAYEFGGMTGLKGRFQGKQPIGVGLQPEPGGKGAKE